MMSSFFGYRGVIGPAHWGELCPEWKLAQIGKRQSPIDICCQTTAFSNKLTSLKYDWQYDDNVTVKNNGISPTFYVTRGKHFLNGGPCHEVYELVQFHIHFADREDRGSEHTIDGKSYAAEIHFVHYKKSYGSFAEAIKHCDGLAVVGAFIGVDDMGNDNAQLTSDILELSDLADVGSEKTISIDLTNYVLPFREYYTYDGSLTTPGCAECVKWIVLNDPIWMTSEAYSSLKGLKSLEGGSQANPGNHRPVQPLHGRTVYSSFDPNRQMIGF